MNGVQPFIFPAKGFTRGIEASVYGRHREVYSKELHSTIRIKLEDIQLAVGKDEPFVAHLVLYVEIQTTGHSSVHCVNHQAIVRL